MLYDNLEWEQISQEVSKYIVSESDAAHEMELIFWRVLFNCSGKNGTHSQDVHSTVME